jgi:hypothetical protein
LPRVDGKMNDDQQARAAKIRAELDVAGELLPASLRDTAYGAVSDVDEPYLVVESAEGVTTFPGIQEGNGERESAEKWFAARHQEIREQIPRPGKTGMLGKLPFLRP